MMLSWKRGEKLGRKANAPRDAVETTFSEESIVVTATPAQAHTGLGIEGQARDAGQGDFLRGYQWAV